MSKYIDTEGLVVQCNGLKYISPYDYLGVARYFLEQIREKPPAEGVVKVTVCGECRHNPEETQDGGCPMAHLTKEQRPDTAWCWKGEPKETTTTEGETE